MIYALFVTIITSSAIIEDKWKSYGTFEECWEAATFLVKSNPSLSARCVIDSGDNKSPQKKEIQIEEEPIGQRT